MRAVKLKSNYDTKITITILYLEAIIRVIFNGVGRLKLKLIKDKLETLKD